MSVTVADHGSVKSADGGDNSTLTKTGLAVSSGDVVVLVATTWSRDHGMSTPTCAGQTVKTVQTAAPGAPGSFWGWVGAWTIKVTGSPGTIDFSCAPADATSTRHTLFWAHCTGGDLDATPATNATTSVTGTTATTTLTTVHDNSLLVWGYVDESSRDPAATTYASGGTQLDINDGHVGSNSVQATVKQSTTTAGAQTIGASNSSSLTLTLVGVEVFPVPPAAGDAASTITASSSAGAALSASAAAASTITAGSAASAAAGFAGGAASLVSVADEAVAVVAGATNQPPRTGVMGWDLWSTLAEQAQYQDYYRSIPPVACPNCGEPLRIGPPNQPGVLYCKFDGWQYPRDHDPEVHSGM